MSESTASSGFRLGAGVVAAIAAGIVFIGLEMLAVWGLAGKSPWAPEHLIAAIALGKDVLPGPGGPSAIVPQVFAIGLAIHFALSIIFGCILAWMIATSRGLAALAIGITFGFALYFIDFYLFTAIFPWFSHSRGPVTIVTHVIFGIVVALFYSAIAAPRRRRRD